MGFNLGAHRRFGDAWTVRLPTRRGGFVVTCHPDHLESLLKAKPADAPSLTGESPLRPILGPNSILTSVGDRHMRQRKLLLPPFHGEAVARYVEMIAEVADREIDGWPVNQPFALAPRMQAVTLAVIMRGVFGIEADSGRGTMEHRMRETIRRLLAASTHPLYQLVELRNAGRREPRGILEYVLPASTSVAVSIIALHHREDVYPQPGAYRPDRFLGVKPGTYTWIPFGGGIRRCLGATLAMAEQRVVLDAVARRTDMLAPDPSPEAARMRNVTMIPRRGARVVVTRRRAA
jgi:cytochrome P450